MFEIFTILTIYSRGSIYERMKILYRVYCIDMSDGMSVQELEFLIGKVSTSIGSTLSVKKTLLHDIASIDK